MHIISRWKLSPAGRGFARIADHLGQRKAAAAALGLLLCLAPAVRADAVYDFADRFNQVESRSHGHNDMYASGLYQGLIDQGATAYLVTMHWGYNYSRQGQYWGAFVVFRDTEGRYWGKGSLAIHPKLLPAKSAQWAEFFCGSEIWTKTDKIVSNQPQERSGPTVAFVETSSR
jgi:hypothetical protein